MRFILPALLVLTVLLYLQKAFAPEKNHGRPELPPEIKEKSFFSNREKAFFAALQEAVGDNFLIFPNLLALDLVEMKGRKKIVDRAREYMANARINAALFDRDTYQLREVIIIQDLTAPNYHDKEWLKNLLEKGGIKVLKLYQRKIWDPAWLKDKIEERLAFVSHHEKGKVTPLPTIKNTSTPPNKNNMEC
ncbi:MAG: DUF2726 domain-containing protein [Firmicutes bacterium]|nr:DUF2726 domain-containing protein [Bacillota bacterium]